MEKLELKNKYYTPTIDEFYVGFEFKSNYILFREGNKGDEWFKHILSLENHGWFWEAYYNDAVEAEFRVKYLDREDIESLGFVYYKTHPGTTTHEFETTDGHCLITFDPMWGNGWNITITDDTEFTYFHGFIKNKSELIKLLKQIGIKNE